ncbi:MAG: S24 family peptidase [Litorimonas sp.]
MKTELAMRLIELRGRTGLSTKNFAEAIGWKASSYQHYETAYKKPYLPDALIRSLLDASAQLDLDVADIEALGRGTVVRADSEPVSVLFPRADLPILGKAMGGIGVFLDNGAKLGDTMRPLTLIGVKDAYAVYIDGESMYPRYLPGELIMVHPHKVVTRGSFVVVQYDDDGERHYTIKRFVKRTGNELHLEQLNPERPWVLRLDRVHSVHRVVGAIDT